MQNNNIEDILKSQITDIMNETPQNKNTRKNTKRRKKKKKRIILRMMGLLSVLLLVAIGLAFGTKGGRRLLYKTSGNFIYNNMNNENTDEHKQRTVREPVPGLRQEDYVYNYLIFGVEEIGGARNTDSMMIATINTKDSSIKLTSLLRDSYVEIPGYKANKLNSAFSRGGANLLMETIEQNYKIKLDGYASVNFEAFENIVDLLGGVTIELGEEEAKYLNTTNYISNKSNRNVKPGVNHLNGNQVMGYVRVRKVKTLGGANNDYGRVVRQQRALTAIFESYITTNIFKLSSLTKECLGYVNTNATELQIAEAIEAVVENKIKTLDTIRIPMDGAFEAPVKYNGIGYPIVLDWETNRVELFKFIFNDTKEEAVAALAELEKEIAN